MRQGIIGAIIGLVFGAGAVLSIGALGGDGPDRGFSPENVRAITEAHVNGFPSVSKADCGDPVYRPNDVWLVICTADKRSFNPDTTETVRYLLRIDDDSGALIR